MAKRSSMIGLSLLVSLLVGLPAQAQDWTAGKIKVMVGIQPVAYFVERVGGPYVDVGVMVAPGQDPHTFEPTPKLMARLSESRVLFETGFPFEEAMVKKVGSMFKNLEVVDLQKGIKLRTMTEDEEHSHGKGEAHHHGHEEGEHDHGHSHDAGESDPHTWLDPNLVKIQARTIADTLIRINPTRRAEYEKNLKAFQADLESTDEQLKKALAPLKGKSFFVFHPAYGYFGDAYGLKQIAVQLGGKEPTGRQLARLIKKAQKQEVKVIFVQPQFATKSAEALAQAIGAAVMPMDDMSRDYLKNLTEMATKLESALASSKN